MSDQSVVIKVPCGYSSPIVEIFVHEDVGIRTFNKSVLKINIGLLG